MKVTIEKVPEGVKVTFAPRTSSKPLVFIIQPGQLGLLTQMIQTAMSSEVFRFELQM